VASRSAGSFVPCRIISNSIGPLGTRQHIQQELVPEWDSDGHSPANDGVTRQNSCFFGWRIVLNNACHDWLDKDGRLFILEIVDAGKKKAPPEECSLPGPSQQPGKRCHLGRDKNSFDTARSNLRRDFLQSFSRIRREGWQQTLYSVLPFAKPKQGWTKADRKCLHTDL
jgi:hypothetical protein